MKTIEVVAALIRDGGKFLICRRPPTKARGLMWEFVGGKVEAGETKKEALARECREELDIEFPFTTCLLVTHEYRILRCISPVQRAISHGGRDFRHVDMKWIARAKRTHTIFAPGQGHSGKYKRRKIMYFLVRPTKGADYNVGETMRFTLSLRTAVR
jgi:8-oxo-dGTP diphosphatase